MKKIIYAFSFAFGTLFTLTGFAQQGQLHPVECVKPDVLKSRAVLIEQHSRGRGSGVLYDAETVITNHHVVKDIRKIWVWIPRLQRSISAEVLYSSPKPDIAVLKLEEKVEDAENLVLARSVGRSTRLFLSSFPFGDKSRLGITAAKFSSRVKFAGEPRTLYFNAKLADWAYGGDSGGGFFSCDGRLAGIIFGNQALQDPEHIYAVNVRGLMQVLQQAGVTMRRESY